jgi:putative tricarboxylic transport membrane protein
MSHGLPPSDLLGGFMDASSPTRRFDVPALVVAVILFVLAALVLRDAASMTMASAHGIGPEAMPYVVGGFLVALGLGHLVLAFREGLPHPDTAADPVAIAWLTGGLIALIACIGLGVGFIPATALLFAATARAFGRRALLVDLAIGAGLGLVVYLLFSKLLALSLPQGPLERLIP